MVSFDKKSIANIVAGFAVVAGILKGFIVDGGFSELEIMIIGTALGYLFGASVNAPKRVVNPP